MKTKMPARNKVVVDSSAIIACLEDGRDPRDALREAFEGYVEVIIPRAVLEELRRLAEQSGQRGVAARLALKLLDMSSDDVTFRVVDVRTRSTDESLLELAEALNAYLITLDRELQKTAKARGIVVLTYVRSKKRFG